jgi:hypothetical protein
MLALRINQHTFGSARTAPSCHYFMKPGTICILILTALTVFMGVFDHEMWYLSILLGVTAIISESH